MSKSEKLDPRQLELLFAMLEALGDEEPDIEAEAKADAELDLEIKEAAEQKKPGPHADRAKTRRRNKALGAELEERHTHLGVPEHQKEWEVVGETTTERLRYNAAHFYKEILHQPIVQNPEPREDGGLGDEVVAGELFVLGVEFGFFRTSAANHESPWRSHRHHSDSMMIVLLIAVRLSLNSTVP